MTNMKLPMIFSVLSQRPKLRQEYILLAGSRIAEIQFYFPLEPGTLRHCLIGLQYNPPLSLFDFIDFSLRSVAQCGYATDTVRRHFVVFVQFQLAQMLNDSGAVYVTHHIDHRSKAIPEHEST